MFGRAESPTISMIAISVTPQNEARMFNLGILLLGIMLISIGLGVAVDVPFVFDETSADVASYTSAQFEQARTSSPDLAGVPIVSSPSDTEILAFPVTGGGSTPEGTTDKKVGELKDSLSARVEPDNSVVRHEAVVLAAKYPGDRTIDQISSIYSYLKNGADSKKGWSYVADTRGIDNFMYANETLEIGKDAGCVGAGDCDDFAILMSALIESIGGTTRIILARNNSLGGHAYTEVYLGNLNEPNNQIEGIIDWLKEKFDTDRIYTHIDTDKKDVWLNLDWGPDERGNTHPGGPFYQGDKHVVLCIRDTFVKTQLKLPEISNKLPKLISLTSDKPSPQDAGAVVTWTAKAKDPEDDQILYRFFLNDEAVTKWIKEDQWTWTTTDYDAGDNRIDSRVRDGMHAGPDGFDGNEVASFNIAKLKPKAPENRPPIIDRLVPDKFGPQEAGTTVTWTAEAKDSENDQISYRFFLNGQPATEWRSEGEWTWITSDASAGDNQVEVRIIDGKHAGQDSSDDSNTASFVITALNQMPDNKTVLNQETNISRMNYVLYSIAEDFGVEKYSIGEAVKFTSPKASWELCGAKILAWNGFNGTPESMLPRGNFFIEIRDRNLDLLYRSEAHQNIYFTSQSPTLRYFNIPVISVTGDFYIVFYDRGTMLIGMEQEEGTGNSFFFNSTRLELIPAETLGINGQLRRVNWIIRAVGT